MDSSHFDSSHFVDFFEQMLADAVASQDWRRLGVTDVDPVLAQHLLRGYVALGLVDRMVHDVRSGVVETSDVINWLEVLVDHVLEAKLDPPEEPQRIKEVGMKALFIDMSGSFREFPVEAVGVVEGWWFVDVADGGTLRCLGTGGALGRMCVVEDGTHRGMRGLVHERHPTYAEVCVRADDGGLVAWVDESAMMEIFNHVSRRSYPGIERSCLCTVEVSSTRAAPETTSLRDLLAQLRTTMIAWAADQHDGHIYEDSRGPFNAASRALELPECDSLGVPAELRR